MSQLRQSIRDGNTVNGNPVNVIIHSAMASVRLGVDWCTLGACGRVDQGVVYPGCTMTGSAMTGSAMTDRAVP